MATGNLGGGLVRSRIVERCFPFIKLLLPWVHAFLHSAPAMIDDDWALSDKNEVVII
jgi:hypothetical protein